jgi:hypothetical protein
LQGALKTSTEAVGQFAGDVALGGALRGAQAGLAGAGGPAAPAPTVVELHIDGAVLHASLVKLKRRRGNAPLGLG